MLSTSKKFWKKRNVRKKIIAMIKTGEEDRTLRKDLENKGRKDYIFASDGNDHR